MLCVGALGCAAMQPRPLVYPVHYQTVGTMQVNSDIADCEALAHESARQRGGAVVTRCERCPDGSEVTVPLPPTKGMAMGAAAGGALGAIGGAIGGDAAKGAAIGAAVGAGAGLLHDLYDDYEPAASYEQLVTRCLGQRGYELYGWSN
ncbi:MAG: hypothetical protein ACREQL_11180 [Candidatus Binatia bacterium]